jgi:hypothetical protein
VAKKTAPAPTPTPTLTADTAVLDKKAAEDAARKKYLEVTLPQKKAAHANSALERHKVWAGKDFMSRPEPHGSARSFLTYNTVPFHYPVSHGHTEHEDPEQVRYSTVMGSPQTGGYRITHAGKHSLVESFPMAMNAERDENGEFVDPKAAERESFGPGGPKPIPNGLLTNPGMGDIYRALQQHVAGHRAKLFSPEGKAFLESGKGKDAYDHVTSDKGFTGGDRDFQRYVLEAISPKSERVLGSKGKPVDHPHAAPGAHGLRVNDNGEIAESPDAFNGSAEEAALAYPHSADEFSAVDKAATAKEKAAAKEAKAKEAAAAKEAKAAGKGGKGKKGEAPTAAPPAAPAAPPDAPATKGTFARKKLDPALEEGIAAAQAEQSKTTSKTSKTSKTAPAAGTQKKGRGGRKAAVAAPSAPSAPAATETAGAMRDAGFQSSTSGRPTTRTGQPLNLTANIEELRRRVSSAVGDEAAEKITQPAPPVTTTQPPAAPTAQPAASTFDPHKLSLDDYTKLHDNPAALHGVLSHLKDNFPNVYDASPDVQAAKNMVEQFRDAAKKSGIRFNGTKVDGRAQTPEQENTLEQLDQAVKMLRSERIKAGHRAYIDAALDQGKDDEIHKDNFAAHNMQLPQFKHRSFDTEDEFDRMFTSKPQQMELPLAAPKPKPEAAAPEAAPAAAAATGGPTPVKGDLLTSLSGGDTAPRGMAGSIVPTPVPTLPEGTSPQARSYHLIGADGSMKHTLNAKVIGQHEGTHGVYSTHVQDVNNPDGTHSHQNMLLVHHEKEPNNPTPTPKVLDSHKIVGSENKATLTPLAQQTNQAASVDHLLNNVAKPHAVQAASAKAAAAPTPTPAPTPAPPPSTGINPSADAPAPKPAKTGGMMARLKGMFGFGKGGLVVDLRKANNIYNLTKGVAADQPKKYTNKQVTKTGGIKHVYKLPAGSFQSPAGGGAPKVDNEVNPQALSTKLRTTSGTLLQIAKRSGGPQQFAQIVREQAPAFVRKHGVTDEYLMSIYRALHNRAAVQKAEKDDPCWDGYEMVGMKRKNGRRVPKCVPET